MTQNNNTEELEPLSFLNFQPLAIRTLADCGSRLLNSIHMTLGMGSEILKEAMAAMKVGDMKNLGEELGDAQWYAAAYCHIWSIPVNVERINSLVKKGDDATIEAFFNGLGHLQELDKNELAYKKCVPSNDIDRIQSIHAIIAFTEKTAKECELDMGIIRAKIIKKLQLRFPDKFNIEDAVNRNIKAEQEVL